MTTINLSMLTPFELNVLPFSPVVHDMQMWTKSELIFIFTKIATANFAGRISDMIYDGINSRRWAVVHRWDEMISSALARKRCVTWRWLESSSRLGVSEFCTQLMGFAQMFRSWAGYLSNVIGLICWPTYQDWDGNLDCATNRVSQDRICVI